MKSTNALALVAVSSKIASVRPRKPLIRSLGHSQRPPASPSEKHLRDFEVPKSL